MYTYTYVYIYIHTHCTFCFLNANLYHDLVFTVSRRNLDREPSSAPAWRVDSSGGASRVARDPVMKHGGFHGHGGTPIAGWFLLGKTPLNWMIWEFGGTPILGNHHMLMGLNPVSQLP